MLIFTLRTYHHRYQGNRPQNWLSALQMFLTPILREMTSLMDGVSILVSCMLMLYRYLNLELVSFILAGFCGDEGHNHPREDNVVEGVAIWEGLQGIFEFEDLLDDDQVVDDHLLELLLDEAVVLFVFVVLVLDEQKVERVDLIECLAQIEKVSDVLD